MDNGRDQPTCQAGHNSDLPPLPVLVPMRDGERIFGPSRSTLYRLHAAKLIDLVKLGRGTFIVTESFMRYRSKLKLVSR